MPSKTILRAMLRNNEIARILREIGEYILMQEEGFKPRAYEKAAEAIEGFAEEVAGIYERGGLKAVEDIPGIGKSIGEKVEELIKTGHMKYYEELKEKMPVNLSELTVVAGLGPKKIKILYQKLGVKDLKDLEAAAFSGKISEIRGFGKKSEENIKKGIEFLKKSGGRFLLGYVLPEVGDILEKLRAFPGVLRAEVAGSIRRRKETVGDADILVISENPKPVMDFFVKLPEVAHVFAHGETKSAVKLKNGMDMDLRVVPRESYGAALAYFTGSKDHNIALREMAVKKGWKLNEYGLFKGEKQIAGKTEEEIYDKLGLSFIEPEIRELRGEIEAAASGRLPQLIEYGDLRGDLQVQTSWTDGTASIEKMAEAAMDAGLEYIVITDHTKRLAMTGGLDEKKIKKQWEEIDEINLKLKNQKLKFKILKGTECDILADGSLDLPDEILEKLDVVGVSVHSLFNLSRAEQTARVKKAISNPNVDILFHPTGRVIQKRPAYDLDMDDIIRVAKETGTVLEIDAYPERLDIKDEYIRKCVEAGVKMSIDSDAHSVEHFKYLRPGVAQARRGWAERRHIVNAWPVEEMLRMLKGGK